MRSAAKTDEDILALARYEVEQAIGYDHDALSSKRANALQYYQGIMPAAPEGNSQLVSEDVADTVNTLMSEVGKIFQTSNVSFEELSEDDEDQAQLESDCCEWQLKKSGGYTLLHEAAHDALLIGNGWLKVTVEEKVDVTEEVTPEINDLALTIALTPTQPNQQTDAIKTKTGYKIRRETTTYKLVVECPDPAVMLFSNARNQFRLDELRMVGERKLFTASDLREMGLSDDEIGQIPDSDDDHWEATRAREGFYQDDTSNLRAGQDAEQVKECYDIYLRMDLGSGVSELRHILYGGSVLIENEPALCIPYATGSPLPMPHRIQGQGMYERMGSVQDAKTDILRSYADNLAVMNSSRVAAVEGDVNMNDLTSARVNGVVRVSRPDAVIPLPSTDSGQQAITGMDYLDRVRSQRGGASVELSESDKQLMKSSVVAAGGAMDNAEKMSGMYARNLVQTLLRNTFMLIHKKLRLEYPGVIGCKLRGKWHQINPGDWQEREYIEVVAGLTSSERNHKIQVMSTVIQKMEQLLAIGGEGVIASYDKLYQAYDKWLRLTEIGEASDFLIDPNSQQAQQNLQRKQQEAQAKDAQAVELQSAMIELTNKLESDKLDLERYKTDQEYRFKYWEQEQESGDQEAKTIADNTTKLQIAGISAVESLEVASMKGEETENEPESQSVG